MPFKIEYLTANSEDYPYYQVELHPNVYFIEVWGASGGGQDGGKGGYSSGIIKIEKSIVLYLYVGGKGVVNPNPSSTSKGGYNGGGSGAPGRLYQGEQLPNGGSGGGATDIRTLPGNWDNPQSLLSRIIVAGAGGGSCSDYWSKGGSGGGLIAGSSNLTIHQGICNGTQSLGGSQFQGELGIGQDAFNATEKSKCVYEGNGGGGGGYRGGLSQQDDLNTAGGGGSSFISGYNGCNSSSLELKFGLGKLKTGSDFFLSPSGKLEEGHLGDGAIRITIFRGCFVTYTFRNQNFMSILFVFILLNKF